MSSLVQSMAVPVTEDTPPDLLAGSMDLTVLLPDGRATKTSVQRATPMMDLLVQLCTAHRLSPGGHSLQPLGEKGALPYKPSTPIGLLDAWSVRLLPKGATGAGNHTEHPNQLPFQHTFRLQVHLPRNQLLVSRVTPQMGLAAVLKMACDEKNLDPSKYELRHPINLEERLRPELTLGDYGLTEVCVVARGDAGGADALALQREQERRRRRVRQQHGHLAPAPPGPRQPGAEVTASTGSVSSGSLGGRSSSPDSTPAVPPPRAPVRKRRPAPQPPSANSVNKQDVGLVISKAASKQLQVTSHHDVNTPVVTHSRTSSDSSGYHEASVLSDGPDTQLNSTDKRITQEMPPPASNSTLPRRSKLPPATGVVQTTVPKVAGPTVTSSTPLSRSMSNLPTAAPTRAVHGDHSTSTSSLSSTGRGHRKKKAAPPPPPVATALAGTRAVSLDRVVASPASKEPQLPRSGDTKSQTLPRLRTASKAASATASIEEEEEKEVASRDATAKHHQQQQRLSSELSAEKADLYAKLQRRLPSRGDSVTSTSSSGSDDTPAVNVTARRGSTGKNAPQPAAAVRPSRSKDKAGATTHDEVQAEALPQPDVVSVPVQQPPASSVSSKHSSLVQDEDDLTVDEGIGNEDAAEEVARAFASATAELEAAILAEDLAAAAEAERRSSLGYDTFDPPCPKSLQAANAPAPPLLPSPGPPVSCEPSEDWHYEIPAPPSAFRDPSEPVLATPWSFSDGEVHSKENPLYNSGEYGADVTVTKDKPEDTVEPTHLRLMGSEVTAAVNTSNVEVVPPVDQSALSGQDRQVQNLLDAKARMLLPPPLMQEQPAMIQEPAVPTDTKLPENEMPQDDLPALPEVQEDASTSQVNNTHSLLHHAGHLHLQHQHTISHHQHDHSHNHHHHHHNHHHEHDSTDVEMPAYLTETIDTLEGFEDLIAVGAGARPTETQETEQRTETNNSQVSDAVEQETRSPLEQSVVIPHLVKTADKEATMLESSGIVEAVQEQRRISDTSASAEAELMGNSGSSASATVEVSQSEEKMNTEQPTEHEKAPKEKPREEVVASQRRRTVEVGGPLVNFTITTYHREIDPDKIFAEEDATTAAAPRPSVVAAYEKRPSVVSRSNSVGGRSSVSSSAVSSRRGSRTEQQAGRVQAVPSAGLKRSASSVYATLQDIAAREEAQGRALVDPTTDSSGGENNSSGQLQSLQVLRSILPQLKSASEEMHSRRSSNTSDKGGGSSVLTQEKQQSSDSRKTEEKPGSAEVSVPETKSLQVEALAAEPVVRQPYRPPAVSFASWGERPRSQAVSIKVDSDYRIGGAHVKAQHNPQEQQTGTTSQVSTASVTTVEKKAESAVVTASQTAATVKSDEQAPPANTAAVKLEPTVIRISNGLTSSNVEPRIHSVQLKAHSPPSEQQEPSRTQSLRLETLPSRLDGTALTMRIISHTTAVPFVRPGSTSVTVNGTAVGNSESPEERVVPVVRAVELKKSVLQQQQQQHDTETNADEDSGKFLGVSSLAKRFSGFSNGNVVQRRNFGSGINKRRPVSELVTASDVANASAAPGGLVHRAGSFTNLITATRVNQPMAGRSDSSDDTRVGSAAGLATHNGSHSPTMKQAPLAMSAAPKGFPVPVVKGFRVPGGNAPEPRKSITIITKPKAGMGPAAPASSTNPHEQLMAAIRGFGGSGSLRNNTQNITECES